MSRQQKQNNTSRTRVPRAANLQRSTYDLRVLLRCERALRLKSLDYFRQKFSALERQSRLIAGLNDELDVLQSTGVDTMHRMILHHQQHARELNDPIAETRQAARSIDAHWHAEELLLFESRS